MIFLFLKIFLGCYIHNTRYIQNTLTNALVSSIYICWKAIFILCLTRVVNQYTTFPLAFHVAVFHAIMYSNAGFAKIIFICHYFWGYKKSVYQTMQSSIYSPLVGNANCNIFTVVFSRLAEAGIYTWMTH